MLQPDREADRHQWMLFQLQRLRGQLVQQDLDLFSVEQKLDQLYLQVVDDKRLAQIEQERIALLLNNFRLAMRSGTTH